jgi:hypothetical protein
MMENRSKCDVNRSSRLHQTPLLANAAACEGDANRHSHRRGADYDSREFRMTERNSDIDRRSERGRLLDLYWRLHWYAHLGKQAVLSRQFPRMEKTRARISAQVARYRIPISRWQLRLHLRKDFAFEQLRGIDLRRLNLRGISFRGANLSGAMMDAHILEAELTGTVLHHATIYGLDLSNLPKGIDFDRARLRDVRCSNREHSGAPHLRGANLAGADLRNANLRDADLRSVDLRNADLRSAILQGADLGGRANLRGANLAGATLYGANLAYADLIGANLRDADLRDANLWQTDLRMADLTGADLRGAIRDEAAE